MSMRIRSGLDHELNELRDMLYRMEGLVSEALHRAMESMKKRDAELAHKVIRADDPINRLRYDIEQHVVATIATQQPVATDLRTLLGVIHVAVEMERMGDHATGVAKATLEICDEPLLKPLIDMPRMVQIATEMLHDAVRAFINNDAEVADAIIARDDEVDNLHDQVFRELISYMIEDPTTIRRATHLLWASHAIERFADRATNIAERILFVTRGQLVDLTSEAADPDGPYAGTEEA